MGYRKASSALGNKTLYSASMKSDNYIWSAGELTGKSVKMVIWHLRYVFKKKKNISFKDNFKDNFQSIFLGISENVAFIQGTSH